MATNSSIVHSNTSLKFQGYDRLVEGIKKLLVEARRQAARSVHAIATASYWEVGRRIVKFEQKGARRAAYGEELLARLSKDLTQRLGRGYGLSHIKTMRQFYLTYPSPWNRQSLIGQRGQSQKSQSVIGELKDKAAHPNHADLALLAKGFPLSWTHYARLLRVSNIYARAFYEQEALRGGWSIRQLDRQIGSQFYERTALSRNKAKMLTKGVRSKPSDAVTPEEEIKDPYILEFLGLKDEYSESDLEEALIGHLETFLLELGGGFTFVARQKRLRIGDEWYRVDLVFFHRKLRCLVLVDLKLKPFTHADAGQMHLYLNYAKERWCYPDENPPVGLILTTEKDEAVAHYALKDLPNKVLASRYKTTLPPEAQLAKEIQSTKLALVTRRAIGRLGKRKG
ncbi:MAG: DUF1016 domain-containing protein [Elusimicrobia bacterium]|nr:DUF1016 domain-containing protein [Elusimicrobiota bacterium]